MQKLFWEFEGGMPRRYRFETRQQAKTVIFEYLEIFYNRQRLHSALGYCAPQEFESTSSSCTP
jgi:putative transposase